MDQYQNKIKTKTMTETMIITRLSRMLKTVLGLEKLHQDQDQDPDPDQDLEHD